MLKEQRAGSGSLCSRFVHYAKGNKYLSSLHLLDHGFHGLEESSPPERRELHVVVERLQTCPWLSLKCKFGWVELLHKLFGIWEEGEHVLHPGLTVG